MSMGLQTSTNLFFRPMTALMAELEEYGTGRNKAGQGHLGRR
jgi:hypothetical protein